MTGNGHSALPKRESCREWVDSKNDRCNERADFILWGKLFPADAMGPRCYDHAMEWLGWPSGMSLDQYAIYDLRPVNALHEFPAVSRG